MVKGVKKGQGHFKSKSLGKDVIKKGVNKILVKSSIRPLSPLPFLWFPFLFYKDYFFQIDRTVLLQDSLKLISS